jgi:hypothetical protein
MGTGQLREVGSQSVGYPSSGLVEVAIVDEIGVAMLGTG